MTIKTSPLLIGSTFPLTLIRHKVTIVPQTLEELKQQLSHRPFVSFWGHENTLRAAGSMLGHNITPLVKRPVLQLNEAFFPVLGSQVFRECWILSPDYITGFRPAIGEEVAVEKITNWQVLRLSWI
jgi:hypothetical protein